MPSSIQKFRSRRAVTADSPRVPALVMRAVSFDKSKIMESDRWVPIRSGLMERVVTERRRHPGKQVLGDS